MAKNIRKYKQFLTSFLINPRVPNVPYMTHSSECYFHKYLLQFKANNFQKI